MTSPIPENGAGAHAMTTECAFCQDNLDAYALGSLPDEEAAHIEQHLKRCNPCQRTLASIRRVTRLLPFLVEPADPSPSVKTRLFARIAESATEAEAPDMPVVLANPWASAPHEPLPAHQPPARQRSTSWQRWIAPGLIAPLAICLIVLSAWTNSLHNEVENLRAGDVTQAPPALTSEAPAYDLQLYEFKPTCTQCEEKQASGQLGGNPNGSVGVVVAWNLDPNEKHQVWCVNRQGEKVLVTDLDVEYTGNVFQTVNFPDALGGYQQIYVARHNGTADPDAELLVALNDQHEIESPATTPTGSTDD